MVWDDGERLQVTYATGLEQENETVPENPIAGVALMVMVPDPPGATDTVAELSPSVSGVTTANVNAALFEEAKLPDAL
jgi:hypothetical protein